MRVEKSVVRAATTVDDVVLVVAWREDKIIARPHVDDVLLVPGGGTTSQIGLVGPATAVEVVAANSIDKHIEARTAAHPVVARSSGEKVLATASVQVVVPRTTAGVFVTMTTRAAQSDHVVSRLRVDVIITAEGDDVVRGRGADDVVRTGCAAHAVCGGWKGDSGDAQSASHQRAKGTDSHRLSRE